MAEDIKRDAERVIDKGQTSASPTDTGAKTDGSPTSKDAGAKEKEAGGDKTDKAKPYDQDPKWQKARAAEKDLNTIREEYGYSTNKDVVDALEHNRELKALIGDRDVKKLLAADKTLREHNQRWEKEQEAKRRADEDPEDTAARLDKKVKSLEDEIAGNKAQQQKAKQDKEAIKTYVSDITSVVDGSEVSDEIRPLLMQITGVDNDLITIDTTDRAAVRRGAKSLVTKTQKFFDERDKKVGDQAVKDYLAGKREVPKIDKADAGTGGEARVPIKNLKDARGLLRENVKEFLGQ